MTKLAAYKAKRDFQKTPEPEGTASDAEGFAFVIQEHDATRLHYDLRLELDGVMKSWAVTKGPSLVPGEKRLAIHVEDHPIAYNGFEGTIPKGQYGGGTVLLWDRGRWEPSADPRKGYKKGHLDFRLHGEKLGGAWHLVRMKKKPGEKQEPWLLIKSDDEFARAEDAPDVLAEMPLSVESGRDLAAIAADAKGAVWDSSEGLAAEGRAMKTKRNAAVGEPRRGRERASVSAAVRSEASPKTESRSSPVRPRRKPVRAEPVTTRVDPMPREVEPCLATLVSQVPRGDAWLHEIKWDGYRLIAFKARGKVRLATRRGLDWTARFPAIAEAVAALPVETAILDGEAIVEDEGGVASFSALQAALSDEGGRIARDAVLVAFDLLYLEGEDLREQPLAERKARLAGLVTAGRDGGLRLGEHLDVDGEAMKRSACRLGLEGVISKRRDRPYRSGRRDDWLKVKCTERQEFVIAGFTPAKAGKRSVGSVVLGYHEGDGLRPAGRSGTGFTAESARETWKRLDAIRQDRPPFAERLTAEERRGVTWVEPLLVAEIEFRGWTGENRLRHAAFKGLREDKVAAEVVRERPADEPAPRAASVETKAAGSRGATGGDAIAGVTLTHPERVLWADDGLTKRDLAAYGEAVAEWLLPQVVSRPLSLVRCPAGTGKHCFFQKHSWAGLSDAIRRESVRDEGGEEEVLYVEDLAGLIALVQASVIEIHPWGATIADVDRPDRIVMDLDPGEGVRWETVIEGAREIRRRLEADGLESFVKTTGGKGLHVVAPLDGSADWARVKAYAKALADRMEGDAPDRYLAKSTKAARRGRIYVDYLRNGRGATAVAAYSARARAGATVSVPLSWAELKPSLDPGSFTILTVPKRLARLRSDPWAAISDLAQGLPLGAGRDRLG